MTKNSSKKKKYKEIKLKKKLKIKLIVINIFLSFLVLFLFDFTTFVIDAKTYLPSQYHTFPYYVSYYIHWYKRECNQEYLTQKYIMGTHEDLQYRETINEKSKLAPIVLFGCSYTYGHMIPVNKIPSAILGKYYKNPIYNRSYHGAGPQLMLYQLEHEDFYNIIPEAKFVIYTYIDDHLRRLKNPCIPSISNYMDIFYKKVSSIDNNETLKRIEYNKEIKKPFLLYWLTYQNVSRKENDFQFLKMHLIQAKKNLSKHWGNTKFIFFVYDNDLSYDYIRLIEKELKQNGIITIYRKDIIPFEDLDTRYSLSKSDPHPNEKAWEYIIPELIKELKRRGIE